MRRRDFITAVGGSAAAWSFAARAQQRAMSVVGVLWHAANAEQEDAYLSVLVKAFNDLGYIEGKNIHFEHRFPAENPDRFQAMARELVDLKPDAIIAVTTIGAVDVKKLTSTIPIVFVVVADPIGSGLVEGLAHPRGNATGLSLMAVDLSGKHLALLKEAVPNLSRVALVVEANFPIKERLITTYKKAAGDLGISLWSAEITGPEDVEPVFAKIAEDRADGVVLGPGGLLFNQRARIGASALTHHLPGIVLIAEEVPYGFLMSYGQDFPDFFRRSRSLRRQNTERRETCRSSRRAADQIQVGPQSQDSKSARSTIPQTLIVSADEMIG